MGRYAQQRKRGGHVGSEPGLPAGPANGDWQLINDSGVIEASWLSVDPAAFGYFRSRWRRPALSMLWTLGDDVPTPAVVGQETGSPFDVVGGQQQDCEVMFCDVDGNPQSQWSAYHSMTL